MRAPDISPLVKGALMIVLLSLSIGQFEALEKWARAQAIEALAWREPLPYFFGKPKARSDRRALPSARSTQYSRQ
jgi:hypothetical protein